MASVKKKIFFFLLLLFSLFFVSLFFFSEKNIFLFYENKKLINSLKKIKNEKISEMDTKTEFRENFKKNKEFRKIVVKKKLFLRRNSDKIILYNTND